MLSLQDRLSIREVCKLTGKSCATVHRWATVGCNGVKLRSEMHGLLRYTCRQWLEEFFQALSAGAGCEAPDDPLTDLLLRAIDGATVPAVRGWLKALLEKGEPVTSGGADARRPRGRPRKKVVVA
jgi:hypothetical protein